jgi:hypothetical protein
MEQLGFHSPEVTAFKKPKTKEPLTKPGFPPLPTSPKNPTHGMPPKRLVASTSSMSAPVKKQPKLVARQSSSSKPVKKRERKLEPSRSAASFPVPDKAPKKDPSPKKDSPKKKRSSRPRSPEGRGRARRGVTGDAGRNDMKVAPTQQVSVNPTSSVGGQGGMSAILKKLDDLMDKQKQAKKKTQQKKAFASVKKAYKDARKQKLAEMKKQHKEIKKRELAKIKKLPAAHRPKMRAELKRKLKERADQIKKSYPTKVSSPTQMGSLVKALRTLRV